MLSSPLLFPDCCSQDDWEQLFHCDIDMVPPLRPAELEPLTSLYDEGPRTPRNLRRR